MTFIERFRELSRGKYDFIRDGKVNIFIKARKVELILLVPALLKDDELCEDDKLIISGYAQRLFPKNFNIEIIYKKSACSVEQIKRAVVDFFQNKFVSLLPQLNMSDFSFSEQVESVEMSLAFYNHIYEYCIKFNLVEELEAYFRHCFCKEIKVELINKGEQLNLDLPNRSESIVNIHDRRIPVSDKIPVLGKHISGFATYICDISGIKERIVLAGKVSNIKARNSKKTSNVFYTFDLDDTTDTIRCIQFTKSVKDGILSQVQDGSDVIVEGSVTLDSYNKDYSVNVKSLEYCTIDYSAIVKEKTEERQENTSYIVVKPEPFIDKKQAKLFDTAEEELPKSLRNSTYVVFDLETTGLNPEGEEIIEIGAVKLEWGKPTQSFSSFINPNKEISAEITKLTGITDDMVKNAPDKADVLADFYKFCKNCVLVGHNIDGFDIKFIKNHASKLGFYFSHETIDTLKLARKLIKGNSHKLGLLCQKLGIELIDAHRAVNDSIATSKLFVKLVLMQESMQ